MPCFHATIKYVGSSRKLGNDVHHEQGYMQVAIAIPHEAGGGGPAVT